MLLPGRLASTTIHVSLTSYAHAYPENGGSLWRAKQFEFQTEAAKKFLTAEERQFALLSPTLEKGCGSWT
jgi:hypothetical protein